MSDMQIARDELRLPAPGRYRLDPGRCEVRFRTRHLLGFAGVTGRIHVLGGVVDVEDPIYHTSVQAELDAASFATGNARRDRTVLGSRYLDAAGFPTMSFRSTGVARVRGGWSIEGSLTVRDATNPLQLQIAEPSLVQAGAGSFTLVAAGRVDRYALGVTAARGMAGRYLDVTLRVLAVPQ